MKSDVWTNFVQTFDFTVKALMISNSLHHRYFQMKTDMNVKIGSYTKLCMQNKILASKMRNLKEQKTSVFAPLILKRWIDTIFLKTKVLKFYGVVASRNFLVKDLEISWRHSVKINETKQYIEKLSRQI